MWKITFTHRGYVVSVVHQRIADKQTAINTASMSCVDKYDAVRAEWVN